MPDLPKQFELVITRSFLKDLKKINQPDQIRIRKSLSLIKLNPYQGRKVVSADVGKFRWRVGKYRIRYDITAAQILILRVIKREDVYRRF
jgi:mRNA interferase RelE/StbE